MHYSKEQLAEKWPTIKKVHFIGITSPFCSFSATTLLNQGIRVTASEANQDSDSAKEWIAKGVLYPGPHNAEFITDDLDLIVIPNGPIPGNPEIEKIQQTDMPYVTVPQLLGQISQNYKTIAIAGTHGKTTTTALVVWLLHKTLGTPNFIVGDAKDRIAGIDANWQVNKQSEYLVLEACEYKRQFLDRAPHPYISVVTHIDLDHTDYYHSQEDYNSAFSEFLAPTKNRIIIDSAHKNEKSVIQALPDVETRILSVTELKEKFGHLDSILVGNHNQENLLRAAGVGVALGLSESQIREALASFIGISSRFEYKGKTRKGTAIYKDFAHNPQKVAACLQGAREAFPTKRLIALYQPHNYERTFTFQTEITEALKDADVLIIPNIYSIRESEAERNLITAEQFVDGIRKRFPNKEIHFTNDTPPYEKTLGKFIELDKENSLLVIMSAGDIDKIIPQLIV